MSVDALVDREDIAKLRGHAEHCRRLAKSFNDKQAVEALDRTAAEYDGEADRLEHDTPDEGTAKPPEG